MYALFFTLYHTVCGEEGSTLRLATMPSRPSRHAASKRSRPPPPLRRRVRGRGTGVECVAGGSDRIDRKKGRAYFPGPSLYFALPSSSEATAARSFSAVNGSRRIGTPAGSWRSSSSVGRPVLARCR